MYVAVKGGERAIENAHRLLAHERRGDRDVPEVSLDQISEQLCARRRSRHDRGLAVRPRAGGARDQAGARRHDRGDLPGARLPRHACRVSAPPSRSIPARCRCGGGFPRPSRIFRAARFSGPPSITPIACWTRNLPRDLSPEAPATAEASTAATPRVTDILGRDGLIEPSPQADADAPVGDLTREPLSFPADRDLRLQNLARADEGFLLALGYSSQRGYGRNHPFAGEIRFGEVEVEFMAEDVGFAVPLGAIALTECQMVNQFKGSATEAPCFTRGYGLAFGQSERKTMSMALVDRTLARPRTRRGGRRAGAGRGVRDVAFRQCAGDRLRRASQAAALCRLPVRARPAAQTAQGVRRGRGRCAPMQEAAE